MACFYFQGVWGDWHFLFVTHWSERGRRVACAHLLFVLVCCNRNQPPVVLGFLWEEEPLACPTGLAGEPLLWLESLVHKPQPRGRPDHGLMQALNARRRGVCPGGPAPSCHSWVTSLEAPLTSCPVTCLLLLSFPICQVDMTGSPQRAWGIQSFSQPLPCGARRKPCSQPFYSAGTRWLCARLGTGSPLWFQSILQQNGDGDKQKKE